ncbi:MAG: carboxylesterase family protein, partial [Actinobacteria bacterium]|nr:carboxylesterase family protein [Actinomycetota bacterium]
MSIEPVTTTAAGRVRGAVVDGVARFLAIPYAEPPVGPLRFAAPVPAAPWAGVRETTRWGATAPQLPFVLGIPERLVDGDDYLHVNVFTPDPAASLPVLMWIHGGGSVHGSNSSPVYDGASWASSGVVLVTVNHRLGVDGFLALDGAPLNRALLDWLLALDWVHTNIRSFGGDPHRVTVGGWSAGAGAALTLAACPRASGLFQQVVAMSGLPNNLPDLDAAARTAAAIASAVGVDPTADEIAAVPVPRLLEAQLRVAPLGLAAFSDGESLFGSLTREPLGIGVVVDADLVP